MPKTPLTNRWRLWVAAAATAIAIWLYLVASVQAVVKAGFASAPQLLHPWEKPLLTAGILCCCRISWAAASPLFRKGGVMHRVGIAAVLVPSVFMLADFGIKIVHAAIWAIQDLTSS